MLIVHDVSVPACAVAGIVQRHSCKNNDGLSEVISLFVDASFELLEAVEVEASVHATIVEVDVAIASCVLRCGYLYRRCRSG